MAFAELIAMKKAKNNPSEGDVFVLQPKEGIYYFGKVIQTNVKRRDALINGMSVVYIYDKCSSQKELSERLEDSELLIAPIIVNNQPWQKGYFETVGKSKVTEKEKLVDYGFWDILRKKYVNYNGDDLEREPRHWTIFGLGSYGVVGKEVQKALAR